MPTGSQYGINLGNILSQASNIKTARLTRERSQLALDKTKAGIALREDVLDKESNLLAQASLDESVQGEMEGGYTEPIETLSQAEVNKLSAQAPEVAKEIQQSAQAKAHRTALKNMYIAKGESEQDAEYKSMMDIDDVKKMDDIYMKKDEAARTQSRNLYAQQGRFVQSILETAQQDPARANQMYQSFRTDSLKQINNLRKQGDNEKADMIEEGMRRQPETLLSQDGKFNASYLHLSLSKIDSMLTTAESYEKEQTATTKSERALRLEQERQKRPSKTGTTKEFQQLMNLLDKETDPKKKKMIQARLDKLSQPGMTSLLINQQTVKNTQRDFATKVGLDDPYKLATTDTREWTLEQQAEGNQVASVIVKGLGANAKAVEKRMANYGAMSEQMKNSADAYEKVGEFRLLDEKVKEYFSNYFGLSQKELESTEAAQAFQSMQNISIKADSGSAVSAQEMIRKTLEVATPTMTKERILMGIRNLAKRNTGELKALKKVMGPVAFNLKYGSILKNYEEIANAAKDTEVKKGDKLAELRKTKQVPRQTLYNQIITQRPNATDAQINAYLTSKGY